MRIFDLRLDHLRDSFGWIVGGLLIVATLAGLIIQYSSPRPPRVFAMSALAIGLVLGVALFAPAAPHIARALQLLAMASPPRDVSGPCPVATVSVALPPSTGEGAPIIVQIWYPTAEDGAAVANAAPAAILPCEQAMRERRILEAPAQIPLLLYAPGAGAARDDNASTSAALASHGYAVMAIDDIDRHQPSPSATGANQAAAPLAFDFSSAESFERTLRDADRKARLEAETALAALDRLAACADADWRRQLKLDRVGFFGFSFGGAAAAEAGVLDARIAAVANLDGWLFGRAASGALDKPYMIMNSDAPIPGARRLQSRDPGVRNEARLTMRDLREEVRLARRPDGYWFWVNGSSHTGYSDQIFDRRSFRSWLTLDPIRMKAIRDAYLLAFFDTHLRGETRPLLRQTPSPYREVEVTPPWFEETGAAPMSEEPMSLSTHSR